MFKVNFKIFFLPLVMLFLALCSTDAQANVPFWLSINGSDQISVGKTNVCYTLSSYYPGTLDSCSIWVFDEYNNFIAANTNNQLFVYVDAPTNECILDITANLGYVTNPVTHEGGHLSAIKYVHVRKPDLQTIRLGLEEASYTNATIAVPIHWNVDDDDRSASGGGINANHGEDYLQPYLVSCNDDDLYSIQAHIGNTALNTANCNLKIKTPDSMRLWYSQNKDGLCCDADSVFETNCNIKTWFNNYANSNGNRLFVEWVMKPSITTNQYIEFYCNNIQFAKLRYKGFAFTEGTLPNKAERYFFENTLYPGLDGCEWGLTDEGGLHRHDCNSIAESVDPEWHRYGERFVATTSSPLCSNIYTLQDHLYNTFMCRCISMDSFGDRSHTFEESDAVAFFTIYNFWDNTFYDINTSVLYSDIIYYTTQFAARKVTSSLRLNCHSSWAMVTSRYFNRPKIIHRAEQLAPTKLILKTYIIGPSPSTLRNASDEE